MSQYLTVDDLTEYELPAGPIATLYFDNISFPTGNINSNCPVTHGGNVLQSAQFLPRGRAEGSAMKEEDIMYWGHTRGNCLSVQYIHILYIKGRHRVTLTYIHVCSALSRNPSHLQIVQSNLGILRMRNDLQIVGPSVERAIPELCNYLHIASFLGLALVCFTLTYTGRSRWGKSTFPHQLFPHLKTHRS